MKTIFTIRGVAIACVVLGHAVGWVYLVQSWYLRDQPTASVAALANPEATPTYQALYTMLQLTLFDVPAFLFASGFFLSFAGGRQGKVNFKSAAGWIKALLPPFGLWVVFGAAVSWLPLYLFGKNAAPPITAELSAFIRFAYFVPLIFQFYLLSPWITRLALTRWKLLLGIAAALHLGNTALWYMLRLDLAPAGVDLNPILYYGSFFFWSWAIYYPLGAVCGMKFQSLRPWLQRWRPALAVLVVVTGALSVLEMHGIRDSFGVIKPNTNSLSAIVYAMSMVFLLLSLGDVQIPQQRHLMNLGTRSLGIYLSHTIVLVTAARFIYHFLPGLVFYPVAILVILFTLALLLPYLLGEILARFWRSTLYRYLFG